MSEGNSFEFPFCFISSVEIYFIGQQLKINDYRELYNNIPLLRVFLDLQKYIQKM